MRSYAAPWPTSSDSAFAAARILASCRGEGRYVDDLSLPGALHLTFVRSVPRRTPRSTRSTRRPLRPRARRCSSPADTDLTVNAAAAVHPDRPADVPAAARLRHGPVRRATSSRSCSPTAARRASTPPSLSKSTTSRCQSVTDPRRRCATSSLIYSRTSARTSCIHVPPPEPRPRTCSRLRGRRRGQARQPADWPRARSSRGRPRRSWARTAG